ncbi:MAG: hypothetical protein WC628_00590 [Candidatus Omnitrophota bacterium]
MDKKDSKNLKKRYLAWLYKVNKEALDRIERKFSQLGIDRLVLKELKKQDKAGALGKFITDLELYMQKKESEGLALKYAGKTLKPDYAFLVAKLAAVEKAVVREFGRKTLSEIKTLYEKEMIERILKSTEHK